MFFVIFFCLVILIKIMIFGKKNQFEPVEIIDPQEQSIIYNSQILNNPLNVISKNQKALLAIIISLLLLISAFNKIFNQQSLLHRKSFLQFLISSINNLEQRMPRKYSGMENIHQHQQLPFCIVLDSSIQMIQTIRETVNKQNYSNYEVLLFNFSDDIGSGTRSNKDMIQNSYYQLLKAIRQKCPEKSIIFFATQILSQNSLRNQNKYFQQYNTWIIYNIQEKQQSKMPHTKHTKIQKRKKVSKDVIGVRIFSVYRRVFQSLHNNDFQGTNQIYFAHNFNSIAIMTGLFQLSRYFSLQIDFINVFSSKSLKKTSKKMYISFQQDHIQQIQQRIPYQNMHSLVQNFKRFDLKTLDNNRKLFLQKNKTITQNFGNFWDNTNKLSYNDMQRVIQFSQILYLPQNHTLRLLEIKRMEELYQTGKYFNQLPICVNINSHNNQENGRYQKVLESITSQNYSNFHIVFIDDFSTDQTLNLTKNYLKNILKFPQQRVSYIRNLHRKYATFNIINAGFNYCSKDSIQIIVDGDDQLIGVQVFKFINAQYQAYNLRVMYSFYIDDKYKEGISLQFKPRYQEGFLGGRRLIYFFGQLRTFRSSLLRKIPLRQHLDEFGNLFRIMYDTALQYPLFQLAGKNYSKSVMQPNYLYFSDYGGNDDSNKLAIIIRTLKQIYISLRSRLNEIQDLQNQKEDQQVRQILQKQRLQYMQVK